MDDNACSAHLNQQRFIVLVKTFLNKNGLFSSPSTYYLKIASVIFKTSVCVLSLILDKRYVFVSYLTKKISYGIVFQEITDDQIRTKYLWFFKQLFTVKMWGSRANCQTVKSSNVTEPILMLDNVKPRHIKL